MGHSRCVTKIVACRGRDGTIGELLMRDLLKQIDGAMFEIYSRAKSEAGYNATVFLRMLDDRGGLATAKYLINSPKPSDGYTHFYEQGRLDLTVEALVVEPSKWHTLFTSEELEKHVHASCSMDIGQRAPLDGFGGHPRAPMILLIGHGSLPLSAVAPRWAVLGHQRIESEDITRGLRT